MYIQTRRIETVSVATGKGLYRVEVYKGQYVTRLTVPSYLNFLSSNCWSLL